MTEVAWGKGPWVTGGKKWERDSLSLRTFEILCYGYVLHIQKINTKTKLKSNQKALLLQGRLVGESLFGVHSPPQCGRFSHVPRVFTQYPLCPASSVENASFSDGETEALRKADIPEVSWPKPRYQQVSTRAGGVESQGGSLQSRAVGTQTVT